MRHERPIPAFLERYAEDLGFAILRLIQLEGVGQTIGRSVRCTRADGGVETDELGVEGRHGWCAEILLVNGGDEGCGGMT